MKETASLDCADSKPSEQGIQVRSGAPTDSGVSVEKCGSRRLKSDTIHTVVTSCRWVRSAPSATVTSCRWVRSVAGEGAPLVTDYDWVRSEIAPRVEDRDAIGYRLVKDRGRRGSPRPVHHHRKGNESRPGILMTTASRRASGRISGSPDGRRNPLTHPVRPETCLNIHSHLDERSERVGSTSSGRRPPFGDETRPSTLRIRHGKTYVHSNENGNQCLRPQGGSRILADGARDARDAIRQTGPKSVLRRSVSCRNHSGAWSASGESLNLSCESGPVRRPLTVRNLRPWRL